MMFREIERLVRRSDWEGTLRKALQLLDEHPNQAKLHGYAGLSHFQLGRFEQAVPPLRRAIVLDEQFWEAGMLLAQALDRLLQFEEALEIAEQFIKVRPSDQRLILLRDSLRRRVPEKITDSWELSRHLDHYEVELTQSD